jgi:hypothetical protein
VDDSIVKKLQAIYSHPKYFLQYGCITTDERDEINPRKPMPYAELTYLQDLTQAWVDNPMLLVHKSRQLMVSWLFTSIYLWLAMTKRSRKIAIRSQVLADAEKLLDRQVKVYEAIPEEFWPAQFRPKMEISVKNSWIYFPQMDSYVYAIAAGQDKGRGTTFSATLLDEAMFQDDFQEIFRTLKPACPRITIVSTSDFLYAAEKHYFFRLIDDEY